MSTYFEIDGSILEGGGQILRMAVSFGAIVSTPIRVTKIRAGRSKPGLAAQHLKGLELVSEMCSGKLNGAYIGSQQIEFWPGKLHGGNFTANPQTAGAISLLLQIALPCALFADGLSTLDLRGGTNAEMAPQIDFMTEVFRPNMERFGASFDFDLHRRGYYPKGGGHVTINISPVKNLSSVTLTDLGELKKVCGWSYAAGVLPVEMAHQMSNAAKEVIIKSFRKTEVSIECYKESKEMAPDNASGIILVGETSTGCLLGGSGLGKRNTKAHAVGVEAATQLCDAALKGGCVDDYTQDQLIILMALSNGKSTIRVADVTLHTKTAIHVAELLTEARFTVTPQGDNGNLIECIGIGFENKNI